VSGCLSRVAGDACHQIAVANRATHPYMCVIRDFACLALPATGLSQEHAKSGYRLA
jgi:hypothetical protein